MIPKYPKTPYWPFSPNLGTQRSGPAVHDDPAWFVGREIVLSEKLDGGNTLIHRGRVYGRSVSEPSSRKWMAMVKKHTAWKVQEPDVFLFGEDIYAVHSIEYGSVPEDRTFYAFALCSSSCFLPFADVERFAAKHGIPVVPVLHRGRFDSVDAIAKFIVEAQRQPSAIGGEREGVVLRVADGFPADEFDRNVCKSVRANHPETPDDWPRRWRPCRTTPVVTTWNEPGRDHAV